jgi:TolB-like protein
MRNDYTRAADANAVAQRLREAEANFGKPAPVAVSYTPPPAPTGAAAREDARPPATPAKTRDFPNHPHKGLQLAIMPFDAIDIEANNADSLFRQFSSELDKRGVYTHIQYTRVKQLLDLQEYGYSKEKIVAEMGKELGASHVVFGSVSKIGTIHSAEVSLVSVESHKTVGSANRAGESIETLFRALSDLATDLLENTQSRNP